MEYKQKPDSYEMKFLNINKNFKYIGGIGEKPVEYKRVINEESNSLFDDWNVRNKKVKMDQTGLENDCVNTICSLQKLRTQYNIKMEEEDKLIPIEKLREKLLESEPKKIDIPIFNNKPVGKMKGITKNNNN
jgi:hypothetical protein